MPKKKEKLPLSKTHPKLAKEAFGWDPNTVTKGSNNKISWKCKKNHTWIASVISRTYKNTGCPYCAGKKTLKNYNDLLTLFPRIAHLAHKWDPSEISPSSKEQLDWRCQKGHKWSAKPVNLTNIAKLNPKSNPCPVCNSIFYTHPKIAKFIADKSLAKKISKGSEKEVEWKCLRGHIYIKSPSNMDVSSGCPYCHGTKVLKGFNDLKTLFPEIAKQIVDIDPTTVTKASRKRAEWKCSFGHSWNAVIGSRTSNMSGCPYCSKSKLMVGFNDLETLHPLLAKEANGWDPSRYGSGSKNKLDWKCKNGHLFTASISDRALKGSGCPYCSGNKVLKGFNDLKSTHPNLISEANGWDPESVSAGSGKYVSWKCFLGHVWLASPQSRALHKTSCPYCSGNKVLKGFNDLKSTHPIIASQAFNWDPTDYSFGSHSVKEWQCKLGHIYKTTINTRTSKDDSAGCPYCHGTKILLGFNDLKTTHPEISNQAFRWDPTKYSGGSVTRLWWICSEGHKWRTTPNSRTANQTGCPTCAISGFDPNESGYLYFLIHPDWHMLQIGITNNPEKRLGQHKKRGWEILENRGPMDGHLTQQWETAILRMLKAKGADLSNSKIAGKFDGYSEAWSKSTFPIKSIKELMRLTEEFEENFSFGKGKHN